MSSAVWKHFGFFKSKDKDGLPYINKEKAVCKLCKYELTYHTNTTNLKQHLQSKHKDVLCGETDKKIKPDIRAAFSTQVVLPKNSDKAKKITKAIAVYVIDDLTPLSTIESSAFRKLINTLEPRYQHLSRKYLSESLLPKMYNDLTSQLTSELAGVRNVALTHDMWTSISTESYGTVTAHYINAAWEMRSVVLQTRKAEAQHTSENIADDLQKASTEWGLDQKPTPYIVTDNAANEVKAIKMLKWLHVSCMGHNINLAVRAALAIPRVNTVVARGRNQVSFFHNSPLSTTVLLDKQACLPETARGHRLIQDVRTRWNSTFDMVERLL